MLMNSCGYMEMRWFALEPGDGTKYRFAFGFVGDTEITEGNQSHLFSGTMGSQYIAVLIAMPHGTGFYELMVDQVLDLDQGFVSYAQGHLGYDNLYTVTAILLAIRSLIQHPGDIEAARTAMLGTRELLISWRAGLC